MNKRELLNEAIDLALKVEEMGSQLFIDYSPHIQAVTLSLHIGGWAEDKDSTSWLICLETRPAYPYYTPDICNDEIWTAEQRFEQVRNEIMEACNVELAHE